ncbi:hypothetical protein BHM03_00032288 [Ensete ventricosum]|uniref:Uncharacterized protein n=1 Tax=Ensete ventricosum TaxID=4639 RepID=A0A445MIL7_ENSVE|nr:hypothetical protein BHM03_00032288 [Ensete ventricosum]
MPVAVCRPIKEGPSKPLSWTPHRLVVRYSSRPLTVPILTYIPARPFKSPRGGHGRTPTIRFATISKQKTHMHAHVRPWAVALLIIRSRGRRGGSERYDKVASVSLPPPPPLVRRLTSAPTYSWRTASPLRPSYVFSTDIESI